MMAVVEPMDQSSTPEVREIEVVKEESQPALFAVRRLKSHAGVKNYPLMTRASW
jgi:hypothetical protein